MCIYALPAPAYKGLSCAQLPRRAENEPCPWSVSLVASCVIVDVRRDAPGKTDGSPGPFPWVIFVARWCIRVGVTQFVPAACGMCIFPLSALVQPAAGSPRTEVSGGRGLRSTSPGSDRGVLTAAARGAGLGYVGLDSLSQSS